MASHDFSHLSNEELLRMYQEHPDNSAPNKSIENEAQDPSLLKNLAQGYGNYVKGVVKGGSQALGDIGASVGNLGISGIEKALGKHFPRIPHPHLLEGESPALGESIGQKVGGLTPYLIPGLSGYKAASLAPNLISKFLAGTGTGAAAGYATNEDNRNLGALTGAIGGAVGVGVPAAFKMANALRSKNIASNVIKTKKALEHSYGINFEKTLNKAEDAGVNRFIYPQKGNISLLKKGGDSKLVYALEKYNKDPTIRTAHDAQKDLNKYITSLMGTKKGTLESDALKEATKLKNRILGKIHESLQKTQSPHLADEYHNLRMGYKEDLGPYLQSKTIQQLEKGKIRPGKFANKLLEEEEFIAKKSKNHPDLLRREKVNAFTGSKIGQGILGGAGAIGGGLLPYEISKLLGLI